MTLKHPCLSHSHCLWYVCLMLIWNSLHIYHPSLKALGNRTQCHCCSRKTVKQIYVHACWWEKGGGRGEKMTFLQHLVHERHLYYFSLWLNKLFINVKSCLLFGSSPRTRHPWTMWMPAAGPEGQQGDQAEILKTDVGVCCGSICFPLCDNFFFQNKRMKATNDIHSCHCSRAFLHKRWAWNQQICPSVHLTFWLTPTLNVTAGQIAVEITVGMLSTQNS